MTGQSEGQLKFWISRIIDHFSRIRPRFNWEKQRHWNANVNCIQTNWNKLYAGRGQGWRDLDAKDENGKMRWERKGKEGDWRRWWTWMERTRKNRRLRIECLEYHMISSILLFWIYGWFWFKKVDLNWCLVDQIENKYF